MFSATPPPCCCHDYANARLPPLLVDADILLMFFAMFSPYAMIDVSYGFADAFLMPSMIPLLSR